VTGRLIEIDKDVIVENLKISTHISILWKGDIEAVCTVRVDLAKGRAP